MNVFFLNLDMCARFASACRKTRCRVYDGAVNSHTKRDTGIHFRWSGSAALSAMMLVCLGACEKEPIRAYRAPKDPPPPMRETADTTDQQGARAQLDANVVWDVPASWTQDPSPREMRVATFLAPVEGQDAVEVVLTSFPGDVGGLLANVNRWRGQVGLGPVAADDLVNHLAIGAGDFGQFIMVREIGENDMKVVGASVKPGDGRMWFVKMLAHKDVCDAIEPEFLSLVRTIRVDVPAPKMTDLPEAPQLDPSMGEIANRLVTWTPPREWEWREPASSMVAMSLIARADERVAITVTPMRGDGGGLLANVNRWRGQIGLSAVASMDEQSMEAMTPDATVFDEMSADSSTRMVVAVLDEPDIVWYLKMTGPAQGVADEMVRFRAFVASVAGEPR